MLDAMRSDQASTGESQKLVFRPAVASDAATCASLIFASGACEFGFFLGMPAAECIEFLRFAFVQTFGRFSWRRHWVAVADDGTVCAVLAVLDGRTLLFDDLHIAWLLVRYLGVTSRTLQALSRGVTLEGELPKPRRHQTLIAHCATNEHLRATGIFSALFRNVLRPKLLDVVDGRQLILDVLVSNTRAQALYRRLGFADTSRRRDRSPRLPSELASIRMVLDLRRGDGER